MYFKEVLNSPSLTSAPDFEESHEPDQLDIKIGPKEMSEVQAAIRNLKKKISVMGKNQITAGMLRVLDTTILMKLTEVLNDVCGEKRPYPDQ